MRKKGFQNTRVSTFFEKTTSLAVAQGENAVAHAARRYGGYLWSVFRRGTPYLFFQRLFSAFSPAFLIARVLRMAVRVLLFVERSAHLLLLLLVLLLLAPLLLLVFLGFSYAAYHARRRANRRFAGLFRGRRVVAFFPQKSTPYAATLYQELARTYTVLVVSDFREHAPGEEPLHPIAAALPLFENCLYLREHYYFYLRRTLLREAVFFATIY